MPSVRKQYPFDVIEPKWQRFWAEHKTFRAPDPGDKDFDPKKKKIYILDMFPYPSGEGLHVGHPLGYIATDILVRYKRMNGFNVLHPMGWDAFGLPAEQHAIERGTHPSITTAKNIANYRRQLDMISLSYDWDRQVDTTDPDYFKWTQWIFLQIYNSYFDPEIQKAMPISLLDDALSENPRHTSVWRDNAYLSGTHEGFRKLPKEQKQTTREGIIRIMRLAREAEVPVWWCEGCKAVLANEEVLADGTCERKGHPGVVRRPLRQWQLKITAYAERLLKDLDLLDWPESIKEMQRNWIGRSEGANVKFQIPNSKFQIEVFTTRPDTLYGVTYMVLAPEHSLVEKVTTPQQRSAVEAYRAEAARKSELERTSLEKEKTGVFTGGHAINPVNNERIPIWVADYVMMGYGTGAIMAVPAHDRRDLEFARKFELPVRVVVKPTDGSDPIGFVGDGVSVDSGIITGLPTTEAKKKITAWLEEKGLGKARVNYKMRDWIFSRQRYWGEPIPIVHCAKCGTVPVPESELPLQLPEMKDYTPTSSAESPLAKATDWVNTKCPKCGGAAKRETNTMPQWAGSCWYYLRYIDPMNNAAFCAKEKEKYWMPVDLYVGGAEHAVLHLLYSRFWHKVLFDLGHISTPEPFLRLKNQGMILGEDNQKMSKSRPGSVINPDQVVAECGADSFRMYEMFMGPLEATKPWSTEGLQGVYRFLGRVWRLFVDEESDKHYQQEIAAGTRRPEDLSGVKIASTIQSVEPGAEQLKLLHASIKKVTQDLDAMQFNTAISQMMIFVNEATKMVANGKPLARSVVEQFVLELSPFAPHLAEEFWRMLGHNTTLAYEPWPVFDEKYLAEDTVEIVVQVNGKVRDRVVVATNATEDAVKAQALASPKVKTAIGDKQVKKIVVIPRKLVNVVVG